MNVQGPIGMIAADVLKLRKRRSVTGWALVLTVGVSLVFYAYLVIAHATGPLHYGPAGGLRHSPSVLIAVARLRHDRSAH